MATYELSQQSKKFIENLRIYLFSSGKNDDEINEIAEELEVHLMEAEKKGKSVEDIIGHSPKEYMKSISNEMKLDVKAIAKYIPLIILGAMSFSIFGDLLEGPLRYSVFRIIGMIVLSIVYIGAISLTFRAIATQKGSKIREFFIIMIPILLLTLGFGGLLLLDLVYETNVIVFSQAQSWGIGAFFFLIVIAISIWAKTMILPFILLALHVPTYALSFTSLSLEAQLITGMIVSYVLIGLYFLITIRKMKKENK